VLTYQKDALFVTLEAGKGIAFSQGVIHHRRFERHRAERAMKLAVLHKEMAEEVEAARGPHNGGASTTEKKEN